jgi:predicted Zn-dependent protease
MKRLAFLALLLGFAMAEPASAQIPGLGKVTDALEKAKKTADDSARIAKGAAGLTLAEEVAIGDAVALTIVGRYGGVWKDPAATRRVNLIGRVLARYATRQDLEWRFGLLDSAAVNAFSAPGGRVFITRALYELAASDDELAGVLAHEIQHIDQRHAVRIIERGELLGGISSLVADNSADFAAYEQAVGTVAAEILDKGFDPGTEYAADRGGRDLAAVTGYAAGGLRAVLVEIGDLAGPPAEVFSTHPSIEARLQKLPPDPPPNPPPGPPPSTD